MNKYDEPFGDWLRREIKSREWKYTEFARRVGVSRGTVDKWMTGKSHPEPWNCRMIAETLSLSSYAVSVNEVLDRAGHIPNAPEYTLPAPTNRGIEESRTPYSAELERLEESERAIYEQLADLGEQLYEIRIRKRALHGDDEP